MWTLWILVCCWVQTVRLQALGPLVCPSLNPNKVCIHRHDQCDSNKDCQNNQVCCKRECGKECVTPWVRKVGICPPVEAKPKDFCIAATFIRSGCTGNDQECPGTQKCCPTLCGTQNCRDVIQGKRPECPAVPDPPPMCFRFEHDCSSDLDCSNGQICCGTACGIGCATPEKPDGVRTKICPPLNPNKVCITYHDQCQFNNQCQNDQICCKRECGNECVTPWIRKTGICPPVETKPPNFCLAAKFSSNCNGDDVQCPGLLKCCPTLCGSQNCRDILPEPRPECPVIPDPAPVCIRFEHDCSSDLDCSNDLICCAGACGYGCRRPEKPQVQNPRQGVCPAFNLVRKEFCATLRLRNDCTKDSDCAEKNQKCCPGICGSRICQIPITEDRPGCPRDKRVCIQSQQLCNSDFDCGKGQLCCFNPSCGTSCQDREKPNSGCRDCTLPRDTGPCKGYFPRYYYDTQKKQCKQFIYGGCAGNKNNFKTLQDCQQRCKPQNPNCGDVFCTLFCEFGFELGENGCPICKCKPNPCPLIKCPGPPDGTCTRDRFITVEGVKCRVCPEIIPCNKNCLLPKDPGPCEAATPRYFYNTETKSCEKFIYGGCQGNTNNFNTLEECQNSCTTTEIFACPHILCMFIPPGVCTRPTFTNFNGVRCRGCPEIIPCNKDCFLPKVTGPCKAYFPRYFYNSDEKECQKFIYGGCQGNANNFNTLEECQKSCATNLPEPVVKPGTCPPNSNPDVACIAIPRPGDCRGDQSCPGNQKCCNQGCGRVCQDPAPACPPVCKIGCPFGNVLDENNCPICQCKTGCKGNVEPLVGINCGSGIQRCPGSHVCVKAPFGDLGLGVCCPNNPTDCPPVCAIFCEFGNVPDENGCPTCKCKEDPCPRPVCPPPPEGSCTKAVYRFIDGVKCQWCPKIVPCKESCKHGRPLPGINCKIDGQQCPKDHFCSYESTSGGFTPCCPKCPLGAPLPGFNCGNVLNPDRCPAGYFCNVHPTDVFAVCCREEITSCKRCCGPPPCCSFCIDCESGDPLPDTTCSVDKPECPEGYVCKTNPQVGTFGVCCRGNPCPKEPTCPRETSSPFNCPLQCVYDYEVINGVRCKVACRRVAGPRGPLGAPCPPTGCPPLGPVEPIDRTSGNEGPSVPDGPIPPDDTDLKGPSCPAGSPITSPSRCLEPDCPAGYTCSIRFIHAVCCPACDSGNPLENVDCGNGPNSKSCPKGYRCKFDGADRFAICCPVCPLIKCPVPCKFGYVLDKDGCDSCQCKPNPCKPPPCPRPPPDACTEPTYRFVDGVKCLWCYKIIPCKPPPPCPHIDCKRIPRMFCTEPTYSTYNGNRCTACPKVVPCTEDNPCREGECVAKPAPGFCTREKFITINGIRCKDCPEFYPCPSCAIGEPLPGINCAFGAPDGQQCPPDYFCYPGITPEVAPCCPICPRGKPLPGFYCGRSLNRQECPKGYFCHTHPTDRFAVCCEEEPTACLHCCGPPPCCNYCIQCDSGDPLPNTTCSVDRPECPYGYICKTDPQIGSFGICCKVSGNPCPEEPVCPRELPPPFPSCPSRCVYDYKVINGVKCKVACRLERGPQGPPGAPCPPTGCPPLGPVEPPSPQPPTGTPAPKQCPADPEPSKKCPYQSHVCFHDSNCKDEQKCCKQGCQYICVDPV